MTPPAIALLSNASYGVMITSAGAGYSTWRGLDVTRWREDVTRDCWGQFCYVREAGSDCAWSIGRQPLRKPADESGFECHDGRAELWRRDGDVETRCAIGVAPNADAEARVLTLVNHGRRHRELEVTSYAEVCLSDRRADRAHPAFAKLFLETSVDPRCGALLARRRPRAANEEAIFAVHASASGGAVSDEIEYETDRLRFLGRGRTPANPAALDSGCCLSGTTGPVLDPIFALRRHVHLEAGMTARLAFVTGAADSYEAAVGLAGQFGQLDAINQLFADASAHADRERRELDLSPQDLGLFDRLAASVVFTNSGLRDVAAAAANRWGQSGLWPHAISGDLPIVLARVAGDDDEGIVRELVRWRLYTRRRGLKLDLVILDARAGEAADRLRSELQGGAAGEMLGKPDGVCFLTEDAVPADDQILLSAAARAVLGGGRGSLAGHIEPPVAAPPSRPAPFVPASVAAPAPPRRGQPPDGLTFWNGFGGFSPDGREYVIVVDGSQGRPTLPPAPWTNVLANPAFGCLVTEAGLGYSWSGNSQMNRLTPWSNDPTSDPSGEAIYLRDEETGAFWTPTPLPLGPRATVTVRHGQGYTRFAHVSGNLEQDLLVFVPPDDPIKVVCLTVRNGDDRPRRLTATYYAEWVLGTARENAPLQVVCEHDGESGALLARNAWSGDFAGKIAFAACGAAVQSFSADRTEFLGAYGAVSTPAAMTGAGLSGRTGPALDPCAAVTTELTLSPRETRHVVFVLGQAEDLAGVRGLVQKYARGAGAELLLAEVQRHWDRLLNVLQVATPDRSMDLMVNRWLVYQVLACRVWARSAFYQSGGAYGFRDQLQDVTSLVYSAPAEARAQILRAAARQFEEGDVQHWWHPPSGIGVRTRITDDLYFLPLVVHHYLVTTGDTGVLDEVVPFIASPVLRDDQEEDFGLPAISEQRGSVYEHCLRALKYGYRLGPHGLPLIGTGDWNDGMNKVGAHGTGESVWNGWFFVTVLSAFAEVAEQCSQSEDAGWCRERAEQLRIALEAHAWDGAWYRRAYFDDGTPLGSAENDECQIDAIPQAWAVISGAASPARTESAMDAVHRRLVRTEEKLIQLFDPPFDKGALQPGYIKGYVPGIRENGGQYTHAATWVALATAMQGRGDHATELWNLINPIHHATTLEEVQRYKVEPYVVAADVYGAAPHTGRGGWTWYTGAASWLYRVAIERILGFQLRGNAVRVEPCIPLTWPEFTLTFRYRSATYRIVVDNAAGMGRGVRSIELDGQRLPDQTVPLSDDGRTHDVRVQLGGPGD